MSNSVPRRSERLANKNDKEKHGKSASERLANKKDKEEQGKPASNAASEDNKIVTQKTQNLETQTETKKSSSAKTQRTNSSKKRQLELEKEIKIHKIAQKEFELKMEQLRLEKEMATKEMELKMAELENTDSYSDLDGEQAENERLSEKTNKTSYVQTWINNLSSVSEENDKKQRKLDRPEEDFKQFMARQTLSKDLPIFSGEASEWMNFISLYRESTRMCGFSDAENIIRLQRCLRGKARESVHALLSFTKETEKIINILENRFGRPEFIVQNLIDSVKKIPSLREEKMEYILEFSSKIQNLAVTVVSLKCQEYLKNPQLLQEIVNKLTPGMKISWGRRLNEARRQGNSLTIMDFSSWLEETAEAVVCITNPEFEQEKEKKKKYVYSISDSCDISNSFKCKYCKNIGHKLEKCPEFKKINVDSRWDYIRKHKVCFSCLGSSHQSKQCRVKKICGIDGCKYPHHQLLHQKEHSSSGSCKTTQQVSHQSCSFHVLLRVAPVTLKGPKGSYETYALFDEGSTVTMLDVNIARKIGAWGPQENLRVRWTNSTINEDPESRKVKLSIKGQNEENWYDMEDVRTMTNLLSLPAQSVDIKLIAGEWEKISGLTSQKFQPPTNAKPEILIGQDNISLIIPRQVIETSKNSPLLSYSKLGWSIHGRMERKMYKNRIDDEFTFFTASQDELYELVKQSFKIDSLGIKINENLYNAEEARAIKILEKTTRRIEDTNRWETGLLWKSDDVVLPNNKWSALTRLTSIEKKMDKNEEFANEYTNKIEEYITKGYARKVPADKFLIANDKRIWYLPHFAVTNPNKPGKIRFVFDAAARTDGVSLNDMLLKGPDLLNSLIGVLFKFRERNIAVTADIKEMFHQVHIREQDRSSQRFLWRGSNRSNIPTEYEMVAMTFGAASSPTSAQYVMKKNAEEFTNEFPKAEEAIRKQHYVDDYLDSFDTLEDGAQVVSSVIEVHRRGGFVIRNWASNSKELLKTIPDNFRSGEIKDMELEKEFLSVEKVLGMIWDPNTDKFSFRIKWEIFDVENFKKKRTTKREVLRIVMSIFDPLGLLNNFIIKGRILLQMVWKSGIGWDDELKGDLHDRWLSWVKEIKKIGCLKIPRCYIGNIFQACEIQLHVFCDASAQAYSAVAYWRVKKAVSIETNFIMSKARVAPLRPISIPRLELQAALLGTRLAKTISESHSLKIHRTYFWTDSKTVLSWINADSHIFKPFVAHRIGEILENSSQADWNWVSTKDNVADEATRINFESNYEDKCRWFDGPNFLKLNENEWPSNKLDNLNIDKSEVKKEYAMVVFPVQSNNLEDSLPDRRRFSSYLRLIRATAWVFRFIDNCRSNQKKRTELLPDELEVAETAWICLIQSEDFGSEVFKLKKAKEIDKSSRIFKLSPFMDNNGLLRIKGRLEYSRHLPEQTKFPILIDPKNYFTKLLIHYYHCKAAHQGQNMVVNELRQKYWILHIRNAVRSCWNACQKCKNQRAVPLPPEMAPLPEIRMTPFVRPFTITGMDYFGPMYVTIGRRREKRYGVLFTCMSTRAVHLEIASSLSTDSAIMAIRRMVGRRGCPAKIYSDNGTNFKGADKEIQEAIEHMNQNEITRKMSTIGIEWKFIPPYAPHMGGSWERLVRSIKTTLRAILTEQAPREEILQTLMIEAESIVNSRPLVHVSLDSADDEALTPNHFLLGSSSRDHMFGLGQFDESEMLSRKHWRRAQCLADHFWRRWVKEYLPVLTKRTKWYNTLKEAEVGDVVLVVDPDSPRNTWSKGLIIKVYPGRDGKVRTVDIKTAMGTFKRPVTKICLMDVKEKK